MLTLLDETRFVKGGHLERREGFEDVTHDFSAVYRRVVQVAELMG